MKNLKKILAWVLLVCMVLTLAACGKKEDEEKNAEAGKAGSKKTQQNQRTFAGVVAHEGYYVVKTLDNGFELQCVDNPDAPFIGKYTKNANGTYALEEIAEVYGSVTLTHFAGDLYWMTAFEKKQGEFAEEMMSSSNFVRLMDDSTFALYAVEGDKYIYAEEDGMKIFRMEFPFQSAEVWQEGNTLSTYYGKTGTYTSVKRGATQLLSLTLYGATIPATLEGDTLTIDLGEIEDGAKLVMTRMSGTKFFCLEDGEEIIVDLCPDGTMTVLESMNERIAGNITFEAGKKLEVVSNEYGVLKGIVVDGDVVRLIDEGEEVAALKEITSDAELMKGLDEAEKLLYPERGTWTLVGAEGEGADEMLAEMKEANGSVEMTFDGDIMVITAAENGETVETMTFDYYFDENELNIYSYDDYDNWIDEYLDYEINGDTMKLTTEDGVTMILQRK